MGINRRDFFKMSGIPLLSMPVLGMFSESANVDEYQEVSGDIVKLYGDGLSLSPEEYAELISKLVKEKKVGMDRYLSGGVVRELEEKFAAMFSKEDAIFFPTGTLANHLSLRILAGKRRRIILQELSHIYMDSADCCQTLSGLNLIPVARDRATFTLDEVKEVCEITDSMVFKKEIGVIMIESPVRRKSGEVFNYDELKKIAAFARSKNVKMHLDGARLFIALPYTGISPAEYVSHFDTVYISLYKYFNAPFGAMVVGPKPFVEEMAQLRKLFGSTINKGWIPALIALHYFDGFLERFGRAVKNSEIFINRLEKSSFFKVERVSNGSNIFKLVLQDSINPVAFMEKLRKKGILLSRPLRNENAFSLSINETFNFMEQEEISEYFLKAAGS